MAFQVSRSDYADLLPQQSQGASFNPDRSAYADLMPNADSGSSVIPENPQQQLAGKVFGGIANELGQFAGLGSNTGADIAAGLGKSMSGILNAGHAWSPSTYPQIVPNSVANSTSQALGVNNPTLTDTAIQGGAQYGPYAVGAAALAPETFLGGLGAESAAGGLYNATQTSKPSLSDVGYGAAVNALLHTGGTLAGHILAAPWSLSAYFKNRALANLNKDVAAGSPLGTTTPEEASQRMQEHYTDANGNPLPVDIGTLTNNPSAMSTYRAASAIPFSGASDPAVMTEVGGLNKQIQDTQDKIAQLSNPSDSPVTEIAPTAQDTLGPLKGYTSNVAQTMQDDVREFKGKVENQDSDNWAPLNNSDFVISGQNVLPDYKAKSIELADSIDPSSPVRSEVAKSNEIINRTQGNSQSTLPSQLNSQNIVSLIKKYGPDSVFSGSKLRISPKFVGNESSTPLKPITLSDMVSHVKTLGMKARSAWDSGNGGLANQLTNMRDALQSNVKDYLFKNGRADLAYQWEEANNYHKEYGVPFKSDSVLKNVVKNKDKYVSSASGPKLADALHKPENSNILQALPEKTKRLALYQLLTKGNETVGGEPNVSNEEVASNYGGLNQQQKLAIHSYAPDMTQKLEQLPGQIEQQKFSQKTVNLSDRDRQSEIQSLNKQLENLKTQRFNTAQGAARQSLLHSLLGLGGGATALHMAIPLLATGTVIGPMIARAAATGLRDPALREAFINQSSKRFRNPLASTIPSLLQTALAAKRSKQ